jgi:cytochrome b561
LVTKRYTATARLLHWTTAAAILAMFVLGIWMIYFKPTDAALRHRLFNLHESLGVTILPIVLLRVIVRISWPLPSLPVGTPSVIRLAAAFNHFGLYALLLVMPVIGFLSNSAQGVPLVWFELIRLPSALTKDGGAAHALSALHWAGALTLFALITAHLGGAAYHTVIRRDDVLQRML